MLWGERTIIALLRIGTVGYRERLGRPQPAWLQRCCRSAQKAGDVVPSPAYGCCAPRGGQPSPDARFSKLLRGGGLEVERRELLLRRVRLGQFARPLPSGLLPRGPLSGGQAPPGDQLSARSLGLCTLRKPRRQDLRAGLVPVPSPLPGRRQHLGDPHPSRPFRPKLSRRSMPWL